MQTLLRYSLSWLITTLLVVLATAISNVCVAKAQTTRKDMRTSVAKVDMHQSNYGRTGCAGNGYTAGIVWPRGSDNQYVIGGTFWLGGTIDSLGYPLTRVFSAIIAPHDLKNEFESWQVGYREIIIDTSERIRVFFYEEAGIRRTRFNFVIEQTLTANWLGELQDVVVIRTMIKPAARLDSYTNVVAGFMFDFAIGKTSNAVAANTGDHCEKLSIRPDLGIYKAWSDDEADGNTNGVMGITIIDGPGSGVIHTARHLPFSQIPENDSAAYEFISSGIRQDISDTGDFVSLFLTEPVDIPVADSMMFTMVLMFSESNDAASDQFMVDIVEHLRTTTSITERADSLDVLPDRIDVFNSIGVRVDVISNPSREHDFEYLSSGCYYLVKVYSNRIVTEPIVVVH